MLLTLIAYTKLVNGSADRIGTAASIDPTDSLAYYPKSFLFNIQLQQVSLIRCCKSKKRMFKNWTSLLKGRYVIRCPIVNF